MQQHLLFPNGMSRFRLFIPFIIGCFYPLSFAPFSQFSPIFSFVIFPVIAYYYYISYQTKSLKQLLTYSGLFGVGLFLTGISWVYVAINVYGQTPWWLASILAALFIILLASFFSLQSWLSFLFLTKGSVLLKERLSKKQVDVFALLVVMPLLWLFFEWLRTWVLTGFPWLFSGYSQLDTLFSFYVPIVGIYGVSYIVLFLSAFISYFIIAGFSKRNVPLLLLPSLIILVTFGFNSINWTEAKGEKIKVAMVQGNTSQLNRWDRNFLPKVIGTYKALSHDLWDKTQVIIWPENAIPTFYHYLEDSLYREIKQKVDESQLTFITGLPYKNLSVNKYYNSLLKIDEISQQFYFKQHLVPFGEYLPFDSLFRGLIEFFNMPMSSFSPAKEQQEMITINHHQVGVTLCFEDTFPSLLLKQLPQADYLLNLSNNGWYGDSLAPHQHLQIARFRALETGRELIRSTTSGISAFIDEKGQIKSQTKQFVATVLEGEVQARSGLTPYVQYNYYAVFMLIFTLIVSLSMLSIRLKDK